MLGGLVRKEMIIGVLAQRSRVTMFVKVCGKTKTPVEAFAARKRLYAPSLLCFDISGA